MTRIREILDSRTLAPEGTPREVWKEAACYRQVSLGDHGILRMTCDYSSCPRIEKNIIDFRACTKMREASTGFLKFLNVFDPNKSVVRKFFKDLIKCLHSGLVPRDLFV